MSNESVEIGRLYLQLKRIADTLQSSQDKIFLELPGMVAWWPGGPGDGLGAAMDMASNMDLTPIGSPTFGYDGHPYMLTDRTGVDYFFGSPFPACVGTEVWVDPTIRGLTVGCWMYPEGAIGASNVGVISRSGGGSDRGYAILAKDSGLSFLIASAPAVFLSSPISDAASVGEWHFVVGRFTPSTEVAIFLDGSKKTETTSIPAAINASTQAFEVGRQFNDNNRIISARIRDIFVCQAALSDELIEEIRVTSSP